MRDPASATAVGCFACSRSGESLETHLHLWFHITGSDVPPPLPLAPCPVSPPPPPPPGGRSSRKPRERRAKSGAAERNAGTGGSRGLKPETEPSITSTLSKSLRRAQGLHVVMAHGSGNTGRSNSPALITLQGFVEVQKGGEKKLSLM